jgi:uncharacterized delta-60 repeat protein
MKKNILILAYLLFYSSYTHAQQAGTLDVSFNGTGKKIETGFTANGLTIKMAQQTDGKIVTVATDKQTIGGFPFLIFKVTRYLVDGSLDNSFGTSGFSNLTFFANDANTINTVIIQNDGKILICSSGSILNNSASVIILRLNTNGSLDTTFDADGSLILQTVQAGQLEILSIALQTDGKIVGCGFVKNGATYQFAVFRFTTTGAFDNSFDTDGIVTVSFGNALNYNATYCTVLADSKILVGGQLLGSGGSDTKLVKLLPNGSLDTQFDFDGKLTIANNPFNHLNVIKIQSNNRILVGGGYNLGSYVQGEIIRLLPSGVMDSTFATNGAYRFLGTSECSNLLLQADERILVCHTGTFSQWRMGYLSVSRLTTNGVSDNTFGTNGTVTTIVSPPANAYEDNSYDFLLQKDGKIVVGGINFSSKNLTFARYHGVTNFGSIGNKMITQIGPSTDQANAVAIRPNGKIISAGYSYNSINSASGNDFALIGYNADGSLDNTFGNNGIVKTEIAPFSNDQIKAITILADGKILVAGETTSGTNKNIIVAKYLADGSGFDLTFGASGKRIVDISATDNVNAMAVQPSGTILIGGSVVNGTNFDFMMARFGSNGSYIGATITSFPNGYNVGFALTYQTDGKILMAGQTGGDFALVRYNSNATIDNTFGTNGKVITTFGTNSFEEVRGIVLQTDGKILVSGNTDVNGTDDFAVVRYKANGSLDSTFGNLGKVIIGFPSNTNDLYPLMSLHSNGKIALAGSVNFASMGLCRLNSNGSLDTGFGISGKQTIDIGYSGTIPNALALQTDGKMLMAGYYRNGVNDDFALVRYDAISSLRKSTTQEAENISLVAEPQQAQLSQNFPNPFSDNTQISYSLAKAGMVSLTIKDLLGQERVILVNKEQTAGTHLVEFNNRELETGLYLCVLAIEDKLISMKMLVVK